MTDDTQFAGADEVSEALVGEGDELVGSVLDERFKVVSPLGAGGMGRVYRGRQLSVDREVAVKVLHGSLGTQEEFRRRFLREARVISGFSHPNIVQPVDFGRDETRGLLYFVMEYIEGLSLGHLLAKNRLEPRLALEIARQVTGALAEAHRQEIIHRDLKAENLILVSNADGSLLVKVVDFGIAFPSGEGSQLTATGQVYGTPAYMAPEQAAGEEMDHRTDLYALGVVLFEMLTGHLPVAGDSSMEVMVAHIKQGPPPLSTVMEPGQVPEPVMELVDDLLETSPSDRPAGALEVRSRIQTIQEELEWGPLEMQPEVPLELNLSEHYLEPVDYDFKQLRAAVIAGGEGQGEEGSAGEGAGDTVATGAPESWEEEEPADTLEEDSAEDYIGESLEFDGSEASGEETSRETVAAESLEEEGDDGGGSDEEETQGEGGEQEERGDQEREMEGKTALQWSERDRMTEPTEAVDRRERVRELVEKLPFGGMGLAGDDEGKGRKVALLGFVVGAILVWFLLLNVVLVLLVFSPGTLGGWLGVVVP